MKKSLYFFSNGVLRRKDNTVVFEGDGRRKFVPVEHVSEFHVFGEVDCNKKLLEFLSQKEIVLHYYDHYGYYMGSFYPREHLNSGYMILKQAEHYMDEAKRKILAYQFVRGAVHNIEVVLKYYRNRAKDVGDRLDIIQSLRSTLTPDMSVAELMGVEGNIREQYYRSFDAILNNEAFRFEKRTRRPPQNYLNTLISFGNSIMYTTCLSEIYKTHLDPRIGFLHTTNFRKFSLNLDLAEIFKPILIDRVILSCVGRQMITENDFERDSEGVILKEKGKRVFMQELDKKFATTLKHRELGRSVSYRRYIRLEAYKLEKHFMGEKEYKPFAMTW
ncbi:type I-B CRISPR-associated endonuclease Cas1b [Aneurinibacillus thermoaerophilus]|uniref:type I-B CRISPR-associated endonuclease Cas1b n=1 Tax=Aneurinibacillus thermoaerophilus TaxID=143495 RepID=UPI002E21B412|nr:type I-B CRISPR-associated endonuclease Cas1b [Aneurinibacillus thermoaerophilus]MED0680463.1 type I-B CRISPR-associated endonuclease Cas1b [Aneurinibacillus thermoaerophilus]MED0766081.1 type I-B CRISPR-associated endonuclease Cas1b [Aneurinibacillus thermoaerophilus]